MPTLRDILGQDSAIANLCAALRSGRVHHAWIFHGPEGVGKCTAAEAFGAALLDASTRERTDGLFEPDADSETQRLIAAGTHPDLHVITKELARFSDERAVRERKLISIPREVIDQHLIVPAQLAPTMRSESRATKVFVVDEAELLHPTTQNAVLKTLEEPPAGAVIVLVTSSEERLLPTIRSRCQRVAFGALDEAAMREWASRSGVQPPPARGPGAWAQAFAAGSPGRLTRALEGGMADWGAHLEPMLAAADRGEVEPALGPAMAELVESWAQAWVKARDGASKDAANKMGATQLLGMLAERSRHALRDVVAHGGDPEPALAALDVIEATRRDIASNVNQKLAFEHLAAGLASRAL